MSYAYEMIVCVVNSGFSDAVMSAAREYGAKGATSAPSTKPTNCWIPHPISSLLSSTSLR